MSDQTTLPSGALAGRYTIERELGRAGMATVYLARDLRHGRLVVLKVLRPEFAAALVRCLLQEGQRYRHSAWRDRIRASGRAQPIAPLCLIH